MYCWSPVCTTWLTTCNCSAVSAIAWIDTFWPRAKQLRYRVRRGCVQSLYLEPKMTAHEWPLRKTTTYTGLKKLHLPASFLSCPVSNAPSTGVMAAGFGHLSCSSTSTRLCLTHRGRLYSGSSEKLNSQHPCCGQVLLKMSGRNSSPNCTRHRLNSAFEDWCVSTSEGCTAVRSTEFRLLHMPPLPAARSAWAPSALTFQFPNEKVHRAPLWNYNSSARKMSVQTHEALFEEIVKSSWRKSRNFRLNPDRQVGRLGADFSKHQSPTVCRHLHHEGKTLGTCSRVHRNSYHPLHSKRPSPGMCPIWHCMDMCFTVANLGLQRCWFLNSFAQLRDHGSLKRGAQQFFSEPLRWWQCMLQPQAKVLRCTRPASRASLKYFEKDVKDFNITSDLFVELGMMCTDENDTEELTDTYGPLYWQGYNKDPDGFKKMIWYETMEELECEDSSTWSVYGRERENAFTHKHVSPERGDIAAGIHHRTDEKRQWKNIHNDERTWATWDHDSLYARIQEEGQTNNFKKEERKKWAGWKPKTDEQTMEFKKVMQKYEGTEDDLAAIQRSIENAAGKVAHHTKAEGEKKRVHQRMSDYVRKLWRDALQSSKGNYSGNKPGKPEQRTWWNAACYQGRKRPKESHWQNSMWRQRWMVKGTSEALRRSVHKRNRRKQNWMFQKKKQINK